VRSSEALVTTCRLYVLRSQKTGIPIVAVVITTNPTYIKILAFFQDGKLALLGCNNCFMSVAHNDDSVVAISRTVGSDEIVQIRSHAVREVRPGSNLPEEEQGSLAQIEVNYV
jgi:hypothetical protein